MIESSNVNNVLIIKYQSDVKPDGKAVVNRMRFEGVKPTATDEQIYAVGAAICGVLMFDPLDIYKAQEFCLVEV